jgi:hypothetical protein
MIRWIWATLIAALMALEIGLSTMTAIAQTAPGGAFDKLSPGNQKVARPRPQRGSRQVGATITIEESGRREGSDGTPDQRRVYA